MTSLPRIILILLLCGGDETGEGERKWWRPPKLYSYSFINASDSGNIPKPTLFNSLSRLYDEEHERTFKITRPSSRENRSLNRWNLFRYLPGYILSPFLFALWIWGFYFFTQTKPQWVSRPHTNTILGNRWRIPPSWFLLSSLIKSQPLHFPQ
jgi:hypothetical protein